MVDHYAAVDYSSRTKIPKDIVEYLISKQTLQAWAGMSLRWRV